MPGCETLTLIETSSEALYSPKELVVCCIASLDKLTSHGFFLIMEGFVLNDSNIQMVNDLCTPSTLKTLIRVKADGSQCLALHV
jgi:hypothetical protein